MEDMRCVHISKTMDILELISNEDKHILILCNFAQVTLDHLEKHVYNPDYENCNPFFIEYIW